MPRRPPAVEPTAAQVEAAARRVMRARAALLQAPRGLELWQRLVRVTAVAIARREAAQQPRAARGPRPTPGMRVRGDLRGPTFDARRAAANDLSDD